MLGIKVINNEISWIAQEMPSNWQEGKKINWLLIWREYSEIRPNNYNPENHILSDISYTIWDSLVIWRYTLIDKEMSDVKAKKISFFKVIASEELSRTDWKILRHLDQISLWISTSLTAEQYTQLLTNRQTIREKSNTLEIQINNCTTNEETLAVNW